MTVLLTATVAKASLAYPVYGHLGAASSHGYGSHAHQLAGHGSHGNHALASHGHHGDSGYAAHGSHALGGHGAHSAHGAHGANYGKYVNVGSYSHDKGDGYEKAYHYDKVGSEFFIITVSLKTKCSLNIKMRL